MAKAGWSEVPTKPYEAYFFRRYSTIFAALRAYDRKGIAQPAEPTKAIRGAAVAAIRRGLGKHPGSHSGGQDAVRAWCSEEERKNLNRSEKNRTLVGQVIREISDHIAPLIRLYGDPVSFFEDEAPKRFFEDFDPQKIGPFGSSTGEDPSDRELMGLLDRTFERWGFAAFLNSNVRKAFLNLSPYGLLAVLSSAEGKDYFFRGRGAPAKVPDKRFEQVGDEVKWDTEQIAQRLGMTPMAVEKRRQRIKRKKRALKNLA